MMVNFAGLDEEGQIFNSDYQRARQLINMEALKRGIIDSDNTCICEDEYEIADCISEALMDTTFIHKVYPVDETQMLVGIFTSEKAKELHEEKIINDVENFRSYNKLLKMLSA